MLIWNPWDALKQSPVGWAFLVLPVCLLPPLVGCGGNESVGSTEKTPLAVTSMALQHSTPASTYFASGSVKSWKTENLGFEVAGRVAWVLEPGKDVDGRVIDPDGKLVVKGTPLAKIESARFEIAVESAEAELEVAELTQAGIQIRLEQALTAEIESAEADRELAKAESQRVEKMFDAKPPAASPSERDRARNLLRTREAAYKSLLAQQKQAGAELKSAEAKVKRATQALKDAKRDLANTTLYGSYQGQVSEVSVVPGSVVSAGSPVLTLQMTNPIKVEVELSAQQSRRIRRRRSLPASFALSDGTTRETTAFVYNVAPSADPTTRTFTLTLLMLNEKFGTDVSDSIDLKTVARVEDVWPLKLNRMMGTDAGVLLIEETSIHRDDEGAFIYLIENARLEELFPSMLLVRRQRVIENDLRIPFLGNWVFRSVQFVDGEGATQTLPSDTLYAGHFLNEQEPPPGWDGRSVALDAGSQWMLRPGDLVQIDLSAGTGKAGYYVPIQAVYRDSESASVFAITAGRVKKIPVAVAVTENLDQDSLVRVDSPDLVNEMQVVVGGVHLLMDGQAVRVVERMPNGSTPESGSNQISVRRPLDGPVEKEISIPLPDGESQQNSSAPEGYRKTPPAERN